ncbi:MAG TPA: hypothetical protein VGF60_00540 [Xanthobacteraceae bacterium]|jgi:hypothetical protein
MTTPQEYRHQAAECLRLAEASTEVYVKAALLELAAEFQKRAEDLERRQLHVYSPQQPGRRRAG